MLAGVSGIKSALRDAATLGHRTWLRYDRDHGELLAAGLTFYGLLSLAPLCLLAVILVGAVVRREQARAALLSTIAQVTTRDLAVQTADILDRMREATSATGTATLLSFVTLLWAASRLFVQLQAALNAVWGVEPNPTRSTREALRRMVVKRLLSFAMVVACGVLLMALVLANTALAALDWLVATVPFLQLPAPLVFLGQFVLFGALLTCFFAVIYRMLPDARIPWRDVWTGGGLTATLIMIGTIVLGMLVGHLSSGVAQGALGSIAAFVFWTYYQAQVFMFGAAFTREWADRDGGVQPEDHARRIVGRLSRH